MKKALFTLIFGVFVVAATFAQEQAVYAQYQVFPILINPGYTGFEGKHEFVGNARSTWAGFPGKPSTYTLLYTAPVGDKLALGGGIFTEKVGDMSTLKLQLNYAFRFRIQKAKIGLGLSTEFFNRNLNNDLLNNPLVQGGDPILDGAISPQRIFDATIGTHIVYDEKFFVSMSLPNTVRARLDEVPTETPEQAKGGLFQHYIFHLGYIVNVPSQNFKIIPSLALRNVRDVPYQIDLNVQGRFLEDKLIAGLTFRPNSSGSMAFTLGSKYRTFQLLYSYDVSFSSFQQYNGGSHELGLSFSFDPKKKTANPVETTNPYN